MNIKSFSKFFGIIILGLFLSGCSTQFAKKYNPPFKHNTPLIKDNIRKDGKAEIQKTLELGPKPSKGKKVYQRYHVLLLRSLGSNWQYRAPPLHINSAWTISNVVVNPNRLKYYYFVSRNSAERLLTKAKQR